MLQVLIIEHFFLLIILYIIQSAGFIGDQCQVSVRGRLTGALTICQGGTSGMDLQRCLLLFLWALLQEKGTMSCWAASRVCGNVKPNHDGELKMEAGCCGGMECKVALGPGRR